MDYPTAITHCVEAFSQSRLSECKPGGFTLVDWATLLAFIGGLVTTTVYAGRRLWRLIVPRSEGFRTFGSLRRVIRPFMDQNERIFRQFGPNSGVSTQDDVRFDLSVWKRKRVEVAANNERIAELIKASVGVIPDRFQDAFSKWLSHIDAFSAHVEDPTVDYRHHQFPTAIPDIIRGKA